MNRVIILLFTGMQNIGFALVLIFAVNFSSCTEKTNHEEEIIDDEVVNNEIIDDEVDEDDDIEYEIVDIDPNEAILGKWELIRLVRYTNNEIDEEWVWEPTGYVEYLSDSLMGWFDYTKKEYTLCKGKYWIRDENGDVYVYRDNVKYKYCILYNQFDWIMDGEFLVDSRPNYSDPANPYHKSIEQYEYYPDIPLGNYFVIYFFNHDMMSLWIPKGIIPFPEYIYVRIK